MSIQSQQYIEFYCWPFNQKATEKDTWSNTSEKTCITNLNCNFSPTRREFPLVRTPDSMYSSRINGLEASTKFQQELIFLLQYIPIFTMNLRGSWSGKQNTLVTGTYSPSPRKSYGNTISNEKKEPHKVATVLYCLLVIGHFWVLIGQLNYIVVASSRVFV